MTKLPRFLKEYASYSKRFIEKNNLMKTCYKDEKIKIINRSLNLAECGVITINEAIKIINEV